MTILTKVEPNSAALAKKKHADLAKRKRAALAKTKHTDIES
jgi:hypothetical protein